MMEKKTKKIIHVDMDYFYAQVELLDRPFLRHKPVAIGGRDGRGVICTCNYVAREYGIKSAMPSFQAIKKCPELIFLKTNFSKYKQISEEIFSLFSKYTDNYEGLSLDEAYLDVTNCDLFHNSATYMAMDLRKRIFESTGLTASAGVSYNKLLAKISSDMNKPNGFFVLAPGEQTNQFIKNIPIKQICGVGKVTYKKMLSMGIKTFYDLQTFNKLDLINVFGSFGAQLYQYARGIDTREVSPHRIRKSLSVEKTFNQNIIDEDIIKMKLLTCYDEMLQRLKRHSDRVIKSYFIKIKYDDFSSTTIEKQFVHHLRFDQFYTLCLSRLKEKRRPIRLLGCGVRFYPIEDSCQLTLPMNCVG